MSRLTGTVALLVLLGATLTCRDGTGPVAGVLKVDLTTPNSGGDGAILLTVTGPAALTSATPGTGLRLFAQRLGTTTRFALTGTLAQGTILTIGVPNLGQASQYVATVQSVAARSYDLRSIAGYSLTVSQ